MLAYDDMKCKYRSFRYVYSSNQDSIASKTSGSEILGYVQMISKFCEIEAYKIIKELIKYWTKDDFITSSIL